MTRPEGEALVARLEAARDVAYENALAHAEMGGVPFISATEQYVAAHQDWINAYDPDRGGSTDKNSPATNTR